jgi:type I restriction enzyme S subunit
MRLRPYARHKPSGIDWLTEVPDHWIITKLKYIASINDEALPETTSPEAEIAYVDIGSIDQLRGIVEVERLAFDNAPSRARRIVRDGDSIISTVRTYLQAIAPIVDPPSNLIVSTGFAVVRPRSVDPRFLSYAVREKRFVETIVARSVGVSYPATNAADIASIELPLPNVLEQRAIAEYLDTQTSLLDHLIAKKRALIEKLREKRSALISRVVTRGLPHEAARAAGLNPQPRLKPSGIDWLGEIPEHWSVSKVRRVAARIQTGGTPPTAQTEYYEDGTVPWFGPGPFNHQIVLTEPVKLIHQSAIDEGVARLFSAGATMVVTIGATLGKVSSIDRPSSCNQQITVIEFDCRKIAPRFGCYQLKRIEGMLRTVAPSATLPILTQADISDLAFVLPPLPEQAIIFDYIDRETDKIDRMIQKVEAAIDGVKEYRAALIFAAVSGKINVREGASASGPELLVAAG